MLPMLSVLDSCAVIFASPSSVLSSRGKIVLGYTEAELRVRGSGYQFIHAADMLHCAENHIRSKYSATFIQCSHVLTHIREVSSIVVCIIYYNVETLRIYLDYCSQ